MEIGGDPYLLNEAMVRSGYAELSTFPPDVGYQEEIREAQSFAREPELGVLSACGGAEVPLPTPTPIPQQPTNPGSFDLSPGGAPSAPTGGNSRFLRAGVAGSRALTRTQVGAISTDHGG